MFTTCSGQGFQHQLQQVLKIRKTVTRNAIMGCVVGFETAVGVGDVTGVQS